MKYLKIQQNGKIYQFEEKDRQSLLILIDKTKSKFQGKEIKFLTSNVFKIKNGENEELSSIFSF